MNIFSIHKLKVILICLASCFLYACSSQKDTAMNRAMQNLTARYNYIYNSNIILNNYQNQLQEGYPDNYNQILPVHITPEKFSSSGIQTVQEPFNDKELDQIITKTQVIISDKGSSNYIDDAYLLLGKAHFFKANYFIATEYFDYIVNNFEKGKPIYMEGLDWKARSLMQLDNLKESSVVLDSLKSKLEQVKSDVSEPLATLAQFSIDQGRYNEAIAYLENAVKKTPVKKNKLRWTFIMAQLFEQERKYEQALLNYNKVQKSNAGFELYFNANLKKIKISGLLSGQKTNRIQQLATLLEDDKNTDYTDQIYFQIAESQSYQANYEKAAEYYQRSVNSSTKNSYQKGLSYLRIADLNFRYLNNFIKAKRYYDSTVNTLPKNYPDYDLLLKKSRNLQYLTKRYEIIALQDTLQSIARLPEKDRLEYIKFILNAKEDQNVSTIQASSAYFPFQDAGPVERLQNSGTFYFNNATAISQGYTDFKKRWGNRKLEDNWRQSIRPSAQTNTQNVANLNTAGLPADPNDDKWVTRDHQIVLTAYLDELPVTPALLAASNEKIIDAYFQIAGFYQQELNEITEATKIYELIIKRYPENKYLAAINYSLYLNYRDKDVNKANAYKNSILSRFPSSVYAKSINDPSFSLKQSALDALANKKYNDVFEQYVNKDFILVINEVNAFTKSSSANYLSSQFAYLKAISIGRTKPVDSLINAFKNIKNNFPTDKLIVPLVNDHLSYIAEHLPAFKKRKFALIDFDPDEPGFFSQSALQKKTTDTPPALRNPVIQQPALAIPLKIKTSDTTVKIIKSTDTNKLVAPKPEKTDGIFNTALSTIYYYVIDVSDASLTLSSSRFGIGQFNRGNYSESNFKHQLTEFDNEQLIFVGNFSNFDDAKMYAGHIAPQLKQIMKVPDGIYKSFIISKENFDKLTNKNLLTQYLEFYKNNY